MCQSMDSFSFVTDKADYITCLFHNRPRCLRQHKYIQNLHVTLMVCFKVYFLLRTVKYYLILSYKIVCIMTELFSLSAADAPHVYVRAWTLCCFNGLISTQIFRRALTASVESCAEIKSAPFSGATSTGRVWR